MKQHLQKQAAIVSIFFSLCLQLSGQSAALTAGGNTTTDQGSISYSIGQVFYTSAGNSTQLHAGIQMPLQSSLVPITLIEFNALLNREQEVELNWSTSSEIDNDYFTIERTKDGYEWKEVLKLKGAGNAQDVLAYSAVDRSPSAGISYYRLKQTDFDGGFSFSHMVQIEMPSSKIEVFPNPTNGILTIHSGDLDFEWFTIYNYQGQKVVQAKTKDSSTQIDISEYPDGIYALHVGSKQNVIQRILITKTK